MWLPAVGAVLFLMVGLVWALTDSTPETRDSKGAAPSTATATAPAKPAGHP